MHGTFSLVKILQANFIQILPLHPHGDILVASQRQHHHHGGQREGGRTWRPRGSGERTPRGIGGTTRVWSPNQLLSLATTSGDSAAASGNQQTDCTPSGPACCGRQDAIPLPTITVTRPRCLFYPHPCLLSLCDYITDVLDVLPLENIF